jgi:ABC-type glycerol-3-phosphate transport system substrate-binding protein
MRKVLVAVVIMAMLAGTAFAGNIFRKETSAATTTALNYTATYSSKSRILNVFIKSAAAITETVTLTFVSKTNTTYDTVLDTQALTAATSYYFVPDGDLVLEPGDGLKVQCTKATANTTIYATVLSESY